MVACGFKRAGSTPAVPAFASCYFGHRVTGCSIANLSFREQRICFFSLCIATRVERTVVVDVPGSLRTPLSSPRSTIAPDKDIWFTLDASEVQLLVLNTKPWIAGRSRLQDVLQWRPPQGARRLDERSDNREPLKALAFLAFLAALLHFTWNRPSRAWHLCKSRKPDASILSLGRLFAVLFLIEQRTPTRFLHLPYGFLDFCVPSISRSATVTRL